MASKSRRCWCCGNNLDLPHWQQRSVLAQFRYVQVLHVHCSGSAQVSEAPDAIVNGGIIVVLVIVLVALFGIEAALLLMTAGMESVVLSARVSAMICLANTTSGIIIGAASPTLSSFSG